MTRFGRTGSIRLLAALVALCLVIALEIFSWRQTAPLYVSSAAAVNAGHNAPGDASGAPVRRDAWLQESLARPLFNSNRRPVEGGMRGLPRLEGIVLAGPRQVAIFAGRSGDHPIIVEAGGNVGAYQVLAISGGGVTVAGPEGRTLIKPVFDVGRPSTLSAETPQPSKTFAK
jgi:hypothetical protein